MSLIVAIKKKWKRMIFIRVMKKLIKRILKEESKTDTPTPEEVKKNDGEVRAYRVTNQDTGEMINVDRP